MKVLSGFALLLAMVVVASAGAQDPAFPVLSNQELRELAPTGMAFIPGGSFQMGSQSGAKDEAPLHKVTLDPFFIDIYEVSNREYERFIEQVKYRIPYYWNDRDWNKLHYPVVGINMRDAESYLTWLGKELPTEAMWERAAKGARPVARVWPWGNSWIAEAANVLESDIGLTTPVQYYSRGGTPEGVFNMCGNVAEWVQDWYDPNYYTYAPVENPVNLYGRERKYTVVRGGSWGDGKERCRTTARMALNPLLRTGFVGMRGVKSAKRLMRELFFDYKQKTKVEF